MPNLVRSQQTAFKLIQRWGGQGFLIRDGVARPCTAARQTYSPQQRGLFLDGSERYFIAALGLAVEPDCEQDQFRFKGAGNKTMLYRITQPPVGPRPNGLVMFYDCNVILISAT